MDATPARAWPDRLAVAATLERLGWRRDAVGSGNWSRAFAGWPGCRGDVEAALAEALSSVYGWQPVRPLAIRLGR